jgi:DNA repair protein RecO (recombination protein O)
MQFDPERFAFVNALCELLNRLTPLEVENRAIYSLILDSLRMIQHGQIKDLTILLWFYELRLLALLGFKPELQSCVECRTEHENKRSGLNLSKGGLVCLKCAGEDEETYSLSPESLAFLRLLQRIKINHVTRLNISGKAATEVDNILHAFLKYHTDDPRELQSLRILSSIQSRLHPSGT